MVFMLTGASWKLSAYIIFLYWKITNFATEFARFRFVDPDHMSKTAG